MLLQTHWITQIFHCLSDFNLPEPFRMVRCVIPSFSFLDVSRWMFACDCTEASVAPLQSPISFSLFPAFKLKGGFRPIQVTLTFSADLHGMMRIVLKWSRLSWNISPCTLPLIFLSLCVELFHYHFIPLILDFSVHNLLDFHSFIIILPSLHDLTISCMWNERNSISLLKINVFISSFIDVIGNLCYY